MDQPKPASPLANEVASKIISAYNQADLDAPPITQELIASLIQEAIDAQTKREQTIINLLIEVLEKIQHTATPPDRSQIRDGNHLSEILRDRADRIHVIASETLNAWHRLNASSGSNPGQQAAS